VSGVPVAPGNRLDLEQLAQVLVALGCPAAQSVILATQLDKRARQLAERNSRSYDEALRHLLGLMQQGWAAQQRGVPPPS